MREVDAAWAAGLFEGEGCIDATRQCSLQLRLGTTDEDVLRRFLSVVGHGSISGPYTALGKKPFWDWCCAGPNAEEILAWFYPYLGSRRRQRGQEVLSLREPFVLEATRERTCPGCGETFAPTFSRGARRRLYCSGACKQRCHRKRESEGTE